MIWALRHNDRAALIKALDPKAAEVDPHFKLNGRPVGAAELAELELQGFETLELVAVPRAYEFDDLVVFLARVRPQQPQQPFSVLPFAFAREADGSFGFLPRGGEKLTYQIVQDWFYFYKSWGGPGNNEPKYCAPDTVKRATHKISLFCTMGLGNTTSPACNADDEKVWNRSQLFLSGVSFDSPGQHAALVAQIKLTIEKMKSAMAADNIDEFAKYMDAGGAKKVKQGFASADETARSRYKAAIAKIEPFFLFDASPLVVVYTKPLDGDIRSQYTGNGVMYFTRTANNEWVWTNASTVTDVDKVFTVGPLYKAALLSKPFSNFEIR